MLKEQDRYWYRRAKERIVTCPTCDRCATVSEFITDGTIPISYWGFTYAKCPACGEISLFDYELMRLTKWGEGRKPPILMIGTGRYIDMLLAASSVYLLATQRLILLPVVFLIMLAVEIAWEIIIKRENPDWYHSDLAFEDATNLIARVGIFTTICRYVVVAIGIIAIIRQ